MTRLGHLDVGGCRAGENEPCPVPSRASRRTEPRVDLERTHIVGQPGSAGRVDNGRRVRRAARAAGAVRHAAVTHRRGIRRADGRGGKVRDERDLAGIDVLSGKVDGPNAPIPHWREYNTSSRRTSLIIDPADGRLPPRPHRPGRFPSSGAAACSAASRATPTRITASVFAASCMGAAFPMRCSPPCITPTCASCRAQAWSPSPMN